MAVAFVCIFAAACSKSTAEQMQMMEKVGISASPEVLEAVGKTIPVQVTVTYPADYFNSQSYLVVTPVLVYEGGQQTGNSYIYQGEKVKDNYKVVPVKGGSVSENMTFDYVKGMERSYLELRCVVIYKDKRMEVPSIKVADGLVTTAMLADTKGSYSYKADDYQEIIKQSTEGQILYSVNSADIRNSELKSQSIQDMQWALDELKLNSRVTVTGTEIIAYASPEGGEELNDKLSGKRAESAQKAWKNIGAGVKATTEVKSVGQDWNGFQEAVAKSNIQDKELILRVLSMYSDPAVRESEIRNMSQIYTEIKSEVFPELRRARFITNSEFKNYSEEELLQLAEKRLFMLDEEGVLRVAAITDDENQRGIMYRYAAEKYGSERALYNLALTYLDASKPGVADSYISRIKNEDPEVLNAKGVIAMQRGNYDEALSYFQKSGNDEARYNMGALDILKGNYEQAASELAGSSNVNEALALIMKGDLGAAASVLNGKDDPTAEYLKAVIAARQGKVAEAKEAISKAGANEDLKERAVKDIEFVKVLN